MDAARQSASASPLGEGERACYAAIMAALSDAVLVVDSAGQCVLANRAFEAFFGAPGERLIDFDANANAVRTRAARGECFSGQLELQTPSGLRWFEARTMPVRLADGRAHGGVVVLAERTDRELLRLHEEFMALASHELRSPLTALGGFLDMLARRLAHDVDERTTQHLARAHAQVQRVIDLVNELTDLSRLQTGKLDLRLARCNLVPLLEQMVETGETLSTTHMLTLLAPRYPVWVMADAPRLEQVLMNLVANAIKYTPDSGRIDVLLGVCDGWAQVRVQDYGPGVAEADRERIFQRYYQARRSSPTAQAGLGLGLYVAREIMLAHGGDLELTASSAHGSIFSARLPLAR